MSRLFRHRQKGFSILEGSIVLAVLSTIVVVTLPAVNDREDRMRMVQVQKDFGIIELRIQRYYAANGEYPPSLEAIGLARNDPWGNPYEYARNSDQQGNGNVRKKHGDVPVNLDFDLYSNGPDGDTRSPLNSTLGLDDIVRAEGGDFVGWSTEYCVKYGCK